MTTREEKRGRSVAAWVDGQKGPALSRMWVLPSIEVFGGIELNTLVFYYGGMAALPLALVIHDVATTRRLHPVTLLGIPALFAGL